MAETFLIKPDSINQLAPTVVGGLKDEHKKSQGLLAAGTYFYPHNPNNPHPDHHTILLNEDLFSLTGVHQVFDKVLLPTNRYPIPTEYERLRNRYHDLLRHIYMNASTDGKWTQQYQNVVRRHEGIHKLQEVRYQAVSALQRLTDLNRKGSISDPEWTAYGLNAEVMCLAEAQALMGSYHQAEMEPAYLDEIALTFFGAAFRLLEIDTESGLPAIDVMLRRIISDQLAAETNPYFAYIGAYMVILSQNPQLLRDIEMGNVSIYQIRTFILQNLQTTIDNPRSLIDLAHNKDFQLGLDNEIGTTVDELNTAIDAVLVE